MPRPYPRTPSALLEAIGTFTHALHTTDGQKASGLSDADFAALGGLAAALTTAQEERDTAERAFRAAVKKVEAAHETAEAAFRPLRNQAANHAAMTPELRAAAGLPGKGGGTTPAPLPAIGNLAAVPRPSGAVFLDWTGPTSGSIRYEVFMAPLDRDGTPGGWTLIGSATATDFTHRTARPGARSAYRVEPVRGTRRGEPSNEAAVHA